MGIEQGLFVIKAYRQGTAATDPRALESAGSATCTVSADTNFVWTAAATSVERWNGSSFTAANVALPGGVNLFQPIAFPDGTSLALLSFSSAVATFTQTITLHFDALSKLRTLTNPPFPPVVAAAFRNLIDAFIDGGRINVTLGSGQGTLRLHLRSLLTGDYLLQNNVLQPAHHPLAVGTTNNFVLVGSEAESDFSVGITSYSLPASLNPLGSVAGLVNNITLDPADGAPNDETNDYVTLSVARTFAADPADISINPSTATTTVPIQIHVPTELILLLDRSGSMGATVGSTTKWGVATSIANLFTKLYNHIIVERIAAAGTLRSKFSVKFGHFTYSGAEDVQFVPAAVHDFQLASTMPDAPGVSPGGGTPIGAAVADAVAHFDASNKWARRMVLLLTDGMENSGSPTLATITAGQFPSLDPTPGTGVILHAISYAKTGETAVPQLMSQASTHDGQFQATASAIDAYAADALLGAFMSLLSNVLPAAHSTVMGNSLTAESGLNRLILVTTKPPAGSLVAVTNPSSTAPSPVPGTTADKGSGFAWTVIPDPIAGVEYGLQAVPSGAEVHAFYDLSVRTRFGIDASAIGEPLRLWAEVQHQGQPVSGVDLRAALAFPNESLGEVTASFVRSGGLIQAVQRKTLDPRVLSAALSATNLNAVRLRGQQPFFLAPDALPGAWTRAALPSANPTGSGAVDLPAVQAQLLSAAEAARHLPFQYGRRSIALVEVAPGRYEAIVPAEQIDYAGLYSADFRADGMAGGFPFQRDQRVCRAVAEPPDPAQSLTGLVQSTTQPGLWVATVTPINEKGQPLGPGLAHFASFQYIDEKARRDPKLEQPYTIDNLDGSYTTYLRLPEGKVPEVAFFLGNPDSGAPGIVAKPQEKTVDVRVRLERVLILDDHEPLLKGAGEFVFAMSVAPHDSPARTVRTRLPESGHYEARAGQAIEISRVVYEGSLEVGSRLVIALGGHELDWPSCLDPNDPLTRYVRTIAVPAHTRHFGPKDEPRDPERTIDFEVWYSVEIS